MARAAAVPSWTRSHTLVGSPLEPVSPPRWARATASFDAARPKPLPASQPGLDLGDGLADAGGLGLADRFDDGLGGGLAHGHQGGPGLFDDAVRCQGGVADTQLFNVARAPDDAVGANVGVQEAGQAEGGFTDFAIPGVEAAEIRMAVQFDGPRLVDQEDEQSRSLAYNAVVCVLLTALYALSDTCQRLSWLMCWTAATTGMVGSVGGLAMIGVGVTVLGTGRRD